MRNINADLDHWSTQLTAVQTYIRAVHTRQPADNITVERLPTIRTILEQLSSFGAQVFKFFAHGFRQDKGYAFADDADNSIDRAFAILIDQISNDLIVLQRAFEQRYSSGILNQPPVDGGYPLLAARLAEADRHAWELYQEIKHLLRDDTTVLCYFNKSPNVRALPYVPVALIGIPAAAISDSPLRFGEIGHELGHHIYWYGRVFDADTSFPARTLIRKELETVAGDTPWLRNWLEEIFADVVGCYLASQNDQSAGRANLARSLQRMLEMHTTRDFFRDDGVYPIPALRPFIYLSAMESLNVDNATRIALREEWLHRLLPRYQEHSQLSNVSVDGLESQLAFAPIQRDGINSSDASPVPIDDQIIVTRGAIDRSLEAVPQQQITLSELLTVVKPVIDRSIAILQHPDGAQSEDAETPASEDPGLNLDTLVEDNLPSAIQVVKALELIRSTVDEETLEDWLDRLDAFLRGSGEPLLLPTPLTVSNLDSVLEFGGWTTGGPKGRGHG